MPEPEAATPADASPPPARQDTPPADLEPPPEPVAPARTEPAVRRVAGIVVDGEDRPVSGAEVLFTCHPEAAENAPPHREPFLDPDWWQAAAVAAAVTSPEGRFEFTHVPETGQASLSVYTEGFYCRDKRIKLGESSNDEETVLKLAPGATLRGAVYGDGDVPISDGVVSVYYSYNENGHAGGGGFTITAEDGRFQLGIHPRAREFTIRVNSDTRGQQFFSGVKVTGDKVVLRYQDMGAVRGKIAWTDGPPAAGLLVCVESIIPEPRVLQSYSGWRHQLMLQGLTNGNGDYEIAEVHPGFLWHVFVVDPTDDPRKAFLNPLSPRWENRFELKGGETKTWDCSITRKIRITGRVLTEKTQTPVPNIQIGVQKDGAFIHTIHCETDKDGAYELFLNSGPGRYAVVATPERTFEAIATLLVEHFGKTFTLEGGEDLSADLGIFEPIELPVRVLSSNGEPVDTIQAEVNVQLPAGRRFGFGSSYTLDGEGRYTFKIYHPVKRLSLEVMRFPQGPPSTIGPFTATVGTRLPEEEIILQPTCRLAGTILLPSGEPYAKAPVEIRAVFDKGATEKIYTRTDEHGRFLVENRLRVAPVTLELSLRKLGTRWTSARLVPSETAGLLLGEIVPE
jgi:hypothetical protein